MKTTFSKKIAIGATVAVLGLGTLFSPSAKSQIKAGVVPAFFMSKPPAENIMQESSFKNLNIEGTEQLFNISVILGAGKTKVNMFQWDLQNNWFYSEPKPGKMMINHGYGYSPAGINDKDVGYFSIYYHGGYRISRMASNDEYYNLMLSNKDYIYSRMLGQMQGFDRAGLSPNIHLSFRTPDIFSPDIDLIWPNGPLEIKKIIYGSTIIPIAIHTPNREKPIQIKPLPSIIMFIGNGLNIFCAQFNYNVGGVAKIWAEKGPDDSKVQHYSVTEAGELSYRLKLFVVKRSGWKKLIDAGYSEVEKTQKELRQLQKQSQKEITKLNDQLYKPESKSHSHGGSLIGLFLPLLAVPIIGTLLWLMIGSLFRR